MYKRAKGGFSKHVDFIAIDWFTNLLSLQVTYSIRYSTISLVLSDAIYLKLFLIMMVCGALVMTMRDNYHNILRRGYFTELIYVLRNIVCLCAATLVFLFIDHSTGDYSRVVLVETVILWTILCYIGRAYHKHALRKRYSDYNNCRSVILVSDKEHLNQVIGNIKNIPVRDYKFIRIMITDASEKADVMGVPVLKDCAEAIEFMKVNVVDEILVGVAQMSDIPKEFVDACCEMGITLHYIIQDIPDFYGNQFVEHLAEYTVVTAAFKSATVPELIIKRAIDIAGGLVGVLLTAIIFIFVTPIIKLQSPGPVFFSQVRIGRNGRKFLMYKFRTMYMDAEERKKELIAQNEMQGFMFKMKDDPRIYPFGKFLRKTSLDEFPQFINVLKGDMSLVGTRPPTVDEYQQYELHHKSRLAAKPGLTGLWQVSGRSDITDFEEVVASDTKYIQSWSILLDIKIIFKTVVIVLTHRGSV